MSSLANIEFTIFSHQQEKREESGEEEEGEGVKGKELIKEKDLRRRN